MSSSSEKAAWTIAIFLSSLFITLHNKIVLSSLKFNFPWTLTCLHSLFAWIGCGMMQSYGVFTRKHVDWRGQGVIQFLSILFMLNIAMSNLTMSMVSLPMHQILRATGPVITLALNWFLLRKGVSRQTLISLIPVVMGAIMTALGDLQFTFWGVFWTMIGVVIACTKSVMTNVLLQGPDKLHPMDLLMRMSLSSAIQCATIAWYTKEIPLGIDQYWIKNGWDKGHGPEYQHFVRQMFVNSLLALLINVVSFGASANLSSLTISVTANIKQVLIVLLSIWMFGYELNLVNSIGVVLAVAGGIWYARLQQIPEGKQPKQVKKE